MHTFPETNRLFKPLKMDGWLEDDCFLLGRQKAYFLWAKLRVYIIYHFGK